MTHAPNHLGNNNPLADDLFNPLVPKLGSENVDIGITNQEGLYSELTNSESEELSLIEEMMSAQSQDDDDYEGSLFNNRPQRIPSNYNNYGGNSYTGRDDDFSVNQDAINSQINDFGSEVIAQGTGLTGEYFDKANLTKSILTRTDTNIDFDWQKGSPDSAIKKNTFSVRWTGQIEATQNETYTFYTQADDGVRLWVNNELIIDDWKQHSRQERSGTIDLEAGEFYDIKLEYFEKKGRASVSLLWSSESQAKEVIPTSFLYPEGYVPSVTIPADLAITAPGESNEQITATLSLVSKGGDYNNEAGLFLVDDETGRIDNLNPGDDGYAAAALAPERRLLVLGSGENQNQTTIPGGSYVGSYLIQNNTTEAFLAHNPHNDLHSNPVAFFSFTSTNPDNFDHLETNSAGENSVNLAWEDLRGGGDKDFNDLIVNVDFAVLTEPTVVPPTNLDFSIVAEGEVRVNGSSDFDGDPADYSDDALIYAGKGFTFNGNLELPVVRDEAGNAITDSNNKEVLLDNAVAVSSNYLYANANGNNRNRYSGLVPPTVVDTQTVIVPNYHDLLSENLFNAIPTDAEVMDFNIRHNRMNNQSQWQQKFPAPGTPDNPTVVKVKGSGLNIPSHVDLSNYVIIVEHGSINFNGSGHDLDNVVLVAQNGSINLSKVQAHNSSVFASKTINMNGQARFSGESLVANGQGNITFDGATATTEESDFLTVISPGNITFNGSSDTRGEFLTAKDFTFNGHSTLYGSIGAKKNITFNGNGTVIGIASPVVNPTPDVTIDDITVVEGDVGTKIAQFNVTLSNPSNIAVTVDYGTEDVTAIAGQDYGATSGTVTFEPGETTQIIQVPIIGDSLDELDKEFSVNLFNPSNVTLSNNLATGTIVDDDNPPELSIEDITVSEGNDGMNVAVFTVNLDNPSSQEITIDYATADGSAIAGEDYIATNGTLTFNPGETTKTITVDVVGDIRDEIDEAFALNLNNASNAVVVQSPGTATIVDNDSLIDEPDGILLTEGSDFEVEYVQPLTVPSGSSVITISYSDLNFDTTEPDSINDALEFALVDDSGKSLIHTIGSNQTAFFNLTEGEAANLAPGVTLDGETITVNLTDVLPGTTANLIARLVNNDGDVNTSVRIDTIFIESGDNTVPISIPDAVTAVDTDNLVNFESLKDVTPSVSIQYQQTSFNQDTQTLTANLALSNQGTYWLDTPLIVVVTKISDPSIRIVDADGLTPDGLSYYDLSNLVEGDRFAPGATSEATEIAFYNFNGVQFTYELVVLSELNTAPEITSNPDLEIIGGQSYSYQVEANNIDNDALTYRLLAAPGNMSIDETTGLISWETTTDDIFNHAVVVEVSDGRGGVDLQTYNLAVINIPANRPPQFTSTPVVDAYINQSYEYDADAVDPDGDGVRYEVIGGPDGLTINPDTGEVEWTPGSQVILGDTVIGQINLPVEVDEFSFSGMAGQQIYFDPLQYSGIYYNWNFDVYAPNGDKIVDTDLRYQNNQLVKLPQTGDYRVVVSSNNSQTGGYGFSVIDLAQTPVTQLDTVMVGKLSPGSSDDIYRFVGNKGQRIFIDKISFFGSVDWRLYDPHNEVVTSNDSMSDLETVLPTDGEYKLAIRGRAGFTNTVDYSFEIITPDEVTIAIELGSIDSPKTISGDIAEKGERDIYTFDGQVGQRILFDRLFLNSTNSKSHTIEIIDPTGDSVENLNLDNGYEKSLIVLPENGLYQIKVDARGENTGTYSFNLLDIDLATTVDLDTKYENTLDPGQETHIYQFEGTKSQRLFIDSLNEASGDWRLYDSSLEIVEDVSLRSDIELVLDKNDTYYLVIAGETNNPVDYQFELITPDTVTEVIEWNTEISRTISEKGEQDIFTFEGIQEQRLFIDSLADSSTDLRFTLVSPAEIKLFDNIQLNGDSSRHPIILANTGTYQLIIDGLNETAENYNFRLLDLDESTLLIPETNISGTLELGRSIQFYQFNGSAGERIYFDSQVADSDSNRLSLYDANNQEVVRGQLISSDWEYLLPSDGNYYLMLRSENVAPVDYDFQIITTNSTPIPLRLNETTNGEISKLGKQDIYTFTGSLGQIIYFDGKANDSGINIEIISPNGTSIFFDDANDDSVPLTLLENGNYQLVVDGVTDTVGDYSFTLTDEKDELSFATVYDGTLEARETALYSFEGTAGQKLDFQSLSNSTNARWTLYAPITLPSESKVIENTNTSTDFVSVLPVDGTYFLALRNKALCKNNLNNLSQD